jgi:hypothetical protein
MRDLYRLIGIKRTKKTKFKKVRCLFSILNIDEAEDFPDEVTRITVTANEEVMRGEKITMVYMIVFYMNNSMKSTKRCYAEFYRLYKKVT